MRCTWFWFGGKTSPTINIPRNNAAKPLLPLDRTYRLSPEIGGYDVVAYPLVRTLGVVVIEPNTVDEREAA